MTYAHRKQIYDADTHMMERPDWIAEFSDSAIKSHLQPFVGGKEEILKQVDAAIKNFKERASNQDVSNKYIYELIHCGYQGRLSILHKVK